MPARTVDALRHLYFSYQRQRKMWIYTVFSSAMLMCLFVVLSLFSSADFWLLTIPSAVIVFSVLQLYRCKDICRTLRQTLAVQHQIDQAQTEAEQQEEEAPDRKGESGQVGGRIGRPESSNGSGNVAGDAPDSRET